MKAILFILLFSFAFGQETNTVNFTVVPPPQDPPLTYTQITPVPFSQGVWGYRLLGSDIKAETINFPNAYCNTASALTDAQVRFSAVVVPNNYTVTGVKTYVRTNGVYTGDNNNKIGLYSYTNGVLTLIASSANNANLWTTGANTFVNTAFTSTLAIGPGVYYVACLYNNSAQTTAPALASGTALNNAAMANPSLTNSAKLYSTLAAQTDLPASVNSSGLTASTAPTWFALY